MKNFDNHPLIKQLDDMKHPDATRARWCLVSAFKVEKLHQALIDGKYNIYELAKINRKVFLKLKNFGPKSLFVVGKALEELQIIQNAEDWAAIPEDIRYRFPKNVSLRSIERKVDKILAILDPPPKIEQR